MDLSTPLNLQGRPSLAQAPPANCFPTSPLSWYLFCSSAELRDKPLSKSMLGRQLVAFRPAGGGVAILEARCSHLGADLGRGRVIGNALQCPYHNWEYGPDGRCTHIPAQGDIPAFAHQACYPGVERHGYVFFFNGRQPLFPLPFFPACRAEDFAAGQRFWFWGGFPWYMAAANSFDYQHWSAAHDRQLLAPPVVDCPHPYARRIRFSARVTGSSIFDRLLRRFAGDTVEVSITNWGGTFNLVTGFFGRAKSYLIVINQPADSGQTLLVNVLVFARRSRHRLAQVLMEPISLWVRGLFTRGFMADEFQRVVGIRYSPHTLVECDRDMIELFHWAAALPREGNRARRGEAAPEASHGNPGRHPREAGP